MNQNNSLISKKAKKASRLVGAGLFLVSFLLVCYFIAVPERNFFNSDYADTLLWANASVDSGALFSSDFSYACLLPFGGHLLMIPFVALFGFSYTAHACGMILFFLLFALALAAMFRALGANPFWTGATLFCIVGALCSSEKLREVYFGHILYYSLGALFLMVGLTLVLTLDKDRDSKLPWRLITLCVWCVLCSTDGLTSLTLFVLPLCAALAFERLCDRTVKFFSAENFTRVCPLLYILCFSMVGLGLGALLRHGFEAPYQEAFSTFSTENDWADNLALFFPSFLCLFTGSVTMYEPFTSFTGISAALRLLFGLLVMAAPIIALFFYKTFHRGEKLLLICHFTVSATMLFAFVFGLLSNAAWRLSPMLFTSLLVALMLLRRLATQPFFRRFAAVLLVFFFLIACLGFYNVVTLPTTPTTASSADLAQYLEERGYTYGYATFWNAAAITALTEDTVKCRAVDLSEASGALTIPTYQADKSWYTGQGGGEKYFLLLTNSEYTSLNSVQIGQPYGVESYNGFTIITLEKDIFPLY